MKREYFLGKSFKKSNIPNWTCPTCNSSTLIFDGEIIEKPTARLQHIPDVHFDNEGNKFFTDFDDIDGLMTRFTGFLKCSDKNCNDYILIAGFKNAEEHYFEDPKYGMASNKSDFYYPLLFDPPLNIIAVSDKYPKLIQDELKKCFSLYWIDNASCANKIRSTVELLLDQEKVKRKIRTKTGKLRQLRTHERVELYRNKNQEIAEILLSIKWIGNAGSHIENLYDRQVLDAFDLLNHALERVYVKEIERLKGISKKINKRKKPI